MSKDIKFNFLNSDEEERYQKHLTLKEIGFEGQLYLKNSSVLCIGAGGLGSSVLLYLAAAGIIAVVVIAQIIIKVVIDTINFFPILPGLLELLGVIVVGQWSWQNLRTSENREAVLDKVQNLKKTYLG